MKRVLVFLPCLTYGGAERQGLAVAQYLQSEGYQVEVWGFPAPHGRAPLKADLDAAGIAWCELPAWPTLDWAAAGSATGLRWFRERYRGWPRQLAEHRAQLPAKRFEVVIPFTFWPCLIAALLMRSRAEVIFWNHRGGDDDAGIDYSAFLVRQIAAQHPVFIANSPAGGAFLRRVFRLPRAGVTIVPNVFVPETEFRRDDVAGRAPAASIRLLQIANFFPEKDLETVLRALALLADHRPRVELHLVGYFPDPAQEAAAQRLATALDVRDAIVFHGSLDRPGVASLLRSADIGLLSSRSEGAPNAVMEYMYFCLPVLGSAIPGIRDLLGRDHAQWLFAVGDPESLAGKVRALAANPGLRHQLGLGNRTRLEEHYLPVRVLPMWSSLLREAGV